MQADAMLNKLENEEPQAIIETLAFMSYNPSIGRVLNKGSIEIFTNLLTQRLPRLIDVAHQKDFEQFHREFIEEFVRRAKTTARGEPLVYGQSQKPLNVFLKVYIHWASRPNQQAADRIRPLLHVPLDSIVMKQVKKLFPKEFTTIVRPAYGGYSPPPQLSLVDRRRYLAWQECFRAICPGRPIVLDVLWNRGRRKV